MSTLGSRLRACGTTKRRLAVLLTVCFCVPYFALERFPIFPARSFEPSVIDRSVPFDPAWTAVYQSIYLLMPLVAWLVDSEDLLRRYAKGFLALSAACFLVFLFFPVVGPRPLSVSPHGLFGLLVRYDGTLNTFPSLHVSLTVYTVLFAGTALPWRTATLWTGTVWAAAIAYATLATKQHYAVDLPPSLVLAWMAHRWAFRPTPRKEILMPSRMGALALAVALCALPRPLLAGEEEDHQALRQLKDVYEQAVRENRLELLAPHLDDDFTGVMLTGDVVNGLDGLRSYWKKITDLMGPGGRYTVTLNPDRSLLFGDLALAKGTTEDVVVTSAGEYRFTGHWTALCRRRGGAWKIVRVQGTMDPVGNPFVKKAVKLAAFTGGGGGLLLGALLGGVVGLGMARRRKVGV